MISGAAKGRRRAAGVTIAAALALVVAGCSSEKSPSSSGNTTEPSATQSGTSASSAPAGESPSAGKNYKITYIAGSAQNAFYLGMECGANKEAKKLGVNLTITGPGNFDPTLQIPIVNGVIAKHPDGIIMAPTDTTALIPPMKQMVSQGIKVVQVDTAVTDKSIAVSSLTSDNFAAGQQAMDLLAKALDGKTGSVLLIDNAPSASATIARGDGVVEQAKKYPNIKLLPRQFDHNQSSNDPKIMDATLSAHPDLIGVIGTYNNAVIGAIPSLKAAGKLGTVKVVTFDADSKLIELVKSGEIYATLAQQVEKMGSMAVGNMVEALNGQQPEKEVALDMVPITQSNVDTPESKALYYPESFDAARC